MFRLMFRALFSVVVAFLILVASSSAWAQLPSGWKAHDLKPVSYTHLTLPTILLV